jgi:N-acetylmuramoyl-L-alanine amidase
MSKPSKKPKAGRQVGAPPINKPAKQTYSLFSFIMLALFAIGTLAGFQLFGAELVASPTAPIEKQPPPEIQIEPVVESAPTVGAVEVSRISAVDDPNAPLVGIVAGHKGYDPGAVCPDGLTEAEINYAVALEVTGLLERRGVRTDLLDEFDDRLTEYEADALISIHSDSCIPGLSGFKVARVTESEIPEAEDLLVNCLNEEYGTYTGLPQHPASITDNMTNYHAFREIARFTPGAIIETGFMADDRPLLEYKPKVVARGIAAGILCFLEKRS